MYDTIIVGAGIAGLAAGKYLTENGSSNFLILESEDKIGGRIKTTEFQGKTFSIGPGWLHGRTGNALYDIVMDLGVQIEKCQYGDDAYFVWDVKEKKDITDLFLEKSQNLYEMFQEVYEKVNDVAIQPGKSVLDVLNENSDNFDVQTDLERIALFINKAVYSGAPLHNVSGMVDFQMSKVYAEEDEEINFVLVDPLGMVKVVDYLAAPFLTKIELNSKVDRIEWDRESHLATVFTVDDKGYMCKNVILTIQSDLLAKDAITFKPEIPIRKRTAWEHIPSVNYCRLFAKFPRKFWPDKDWLIAVKENVNPFDELILWQNCEKLNLCNKGDNILVCHYVPSVDNDHCKFDVPKEQLIELVAASMESMFPDSFSKPDDVKFVSFRHDSGWAGAFSIASRDIDQDMIEALGERVGPLYFAGESTSIELLGTMQAAYTTGQDAALQTMI